MRAMPWGAVLGSFWLLLSVFLSGSNALVGLTARGAEGFSFPPGTEVRLLSPDLKTLYAAWRVQEGRLSPLSPPLAPKAGQEVRLLVSEPGKKLITLEAVADKGDVWIILGKERVSFLKLLKELGLSPPERLWP